MLNVISTCRDILCVDINVDKRCVDHSTSIFMYQFHHNLFPDDLLEPNYFTMNNEVHNYNTRGATNIHLGLVNTCLAYNTIRIQGALLWNTLPTSLKNAPSISVFKRSYKKVLMDNYHS